MASGTLALTRELAQRGRRAVEDPGPPPTGYLTAAELGASLAAVLAKASGEVWVFAYGSLIWNPCFAFVERRIAQVAGHHRRFCLLIRRFRGTPERPGLMLALDRGGSCRGLAYRIDPARLEAELTPLWRREMLTSAYRPRWVAARTPRGTVPAIAFVANRRHERYVGALPDTETAAMLASACGHAGSCAEYLHETVASLEALGIRDRGLWRLQALVAARLRAELQAAASVA
jgi:cation transport protein ChaC